MATKTNSFAKCETITEVLGQLAGAASTCWDNGETPFAAPIFDSTTAGEFTADAEARIKELIAEANSAAFR